MTYIIKTHIKVVFDSYVNLFLSVKYFQVKIFSDKENTFQMFGCNPEYMTENNFWCLSWTEIFFQCLFSNIWFVHNNFKKYKLISP